MTPGTYLASSAPLGTEVLERAVLLGVPAAVLAEESAATFWRWCPPPVAVTVQLPADARPALPPSVRVRRTRHPDFVATSDGRRVTSAARTVVDLGRIWPRARLGATDDIRVRPAESVADVRSALRGLHERGKRTA